MDLLSNFRNKQIIRSQISCPDDLNVWLDHCEYMIHAEFDKGTKQIYRNKKRKNQIDQNFKNAIENFNRQQKVEFYLRLVHFLQNLSQGIQEPPKSQIDPKPIQGDCQCRSFNLKIWKPKKIRLYKDRHQIMVQNQKDGKIKSYQLRNYLIRKSKIKDKYALVLQSINNKPHQKSRTVHIAFKDSQSLKKWFAYIKQEIQICEYLNVKDMFLGNSIKSSIVTQYKLKSKASFSERDDLTSQAGSNYSRKDSSKNSQFSYKQKSSQNNTNSSKKQQTKSQISPKPQKIQAQTNQQKQSVSSISQKSPTKKQKPVQQSKSAKQSKPNENGSKQQKKNQKSPKKQNSQNGSALQLKKSESTDQIDEQKLFEVQQNLDKQQEQLSGKRKTFIQHLVNDDCTNFDQFYDVMQSETQIDVQQKKNLDFFHKLMPQYDLQEVTQLGGYQTQVNQNGNFQILRSIDNPHKFKLIITLDSNRYTPKKIFCMISDPKLVTQNNQNVQEITIKTLLKSQNSAITYQTLKAYNKFYRSRDFIFVRHAFTHKNNIYMIDKSIDNINFPPFITLVRGDMSAVWAILPNEKQKNIRIYADFHLVNSGLLSVQQEANLTLRYLNGFNLILRSDPPAQQISSLFDINWNIDNKQINKKIQQIRVRRKTIKIQKNKLVQKEQAKQNQSNINKNPNINFSKKSSSYVEAPPSKNNQRSYETSPTKNNIPEEQYKQVEQKTQQQNVSPPKAKNDKVQPKKEINNNQKTKNKQSKNDKQINNSNQGHNDKEIKDTKGKQNKKQGKKQVASQQNNQQHPSTQTTIVRKQPHPSTQMNVVRKLDKQGLVIIDKRYTKNKFILKPVQKQQYKEWPKIKGHAIWKGDWIHDVKEGGIIFINQKKIQDQKGVLKFILTKIGKNILSGKSVLNISLPVDIFAPQSNLQRLLLSMVYAPRLLQNLNNSSPIQKLIKTVAFAVTNSVVYLNMEKPFNPILGQTFQCWINGCPGYAQQISHHPPIAALMFYGRGYRITCQLQSKVQLHMNSGCGTNQGIYKVQFDDGTQICFITPGGQVSGLTYGDRKFNLVGKSYFWMYKEKLFVELNYDIGKKSFFSKQDKSSDFFEGKLYEVNNDFFNVFPKSKKRQPNQKERVKQLGKFDGVWNKSVKFNNKQIINFDQVAPLWLQYQSQPLASDSNWRQDIEYRRLDKTTRAQTQKQRLEVIQRNDRKFRAKYHKK